MCLLNHEQSSLMTFAVSQKRASSIWLSFAHYFVISSRNHFAVRQKRASSLWLTFAHYIIKIDKKELQFYGLIRVLRRPLTL